MIERHSSFLKTFPRKPRPNRARGFPARLVLLAGSLTLLVVLIVLIVNRSLEPSGVGYFLYWLHDHVYLPVKGYLFSLYFPWSLVGWGVLLTFLVLSLTAWLCSVSFIAEPHLYLARLAVSRENFHPFLIWSSKYLQRLAGPSRFLDEVIERYREEALIRLWTTAKPDQDRIDDAFRFSMLHLRFLTLPGSGRGNHARALSIFHGAVSRLLFFRADHVKTIDPMIRDMFQEISSPVLALAKQERKNDGPRTDHCFGLESLAGDCCRLACLADPLTRAKILPLSGPARPERVGHAVLIRLVPETEARLAVLTRLYTFFERRALFPENQEAMDASEYGEIALDPDEAAISGSLAMGLALDSALLASNPEIGLAFLEAVESLRLAMHMCGNAYTPREEALVQKVVNLIRDIPSPENYRACAELSRADVGRRERIWRQSPLFGTNGTDGTIQSTDFALEKTRVRSLFQAAGPGLDRYDPPSSLPEPL